MMVLHLYQVAFIVLVMHLTGHLHLDNSVLKLLLHLQVITVTNRFLLLQVLPMFIKEHLASK